VLFVFLLRAELNGNINILSCRKKHSSSVMVLLVDILKSIVAEAESIDRGMIEHFLKPLIEVR